MSNHPYTVILPPLPVPIRVAIIEDDPRLRESLRLLVESPPTTTCVGTFPNAESGIDQLPRINPDVLLLDIHLPGMSGIDAAVRIRTLLPALPILILTVYEDAETIFDALRHGASGYLVKRTAPSALIEAIQQVHSGGSPMSPNIARKVVQHFHQLGPSTKPSENLTPREQEVLALLAQGQLYKEIAGALGIGVETVRTHLSSIYSKLHVRTRTEAVVKYLGTRPQS